MIACVEKSGLTKKPAAVSARSLAVFLCPLSKSWKRVRKQIILEWNIYPASTPVFPDRGLTSSSYHPVLPGGSFIVNISSRERENCPSSGENANIHMVTADDRPVDTCQSKDNSTGLLKVSYRDYKWDCTPPQEAAGFKSSPYALLALEQHQEAQVG